MGRVLSVGIWGAVRQLACENARTCEVTTKVPNFMTSFVSGMALLSYNRVFQTQIKSSSSLDLEPSATLQSTFRCGCVAETTDRNGRFLAPSMHLRTKRF